LLASLFLGGAVLASAVLAPRFDPDTARWQAAIGFSLSACCSPWRHRPSHYLLLAVLHAACGITTGMSLSVTHGTIARGSNPHRGFALVGMALGVFAILFLGSCAAGRRQPGWPCLFYLFAGVMAVGAGMRWPFRVPRPTVCHGCAAPPVPRQVWYGIVGIACMGLVQSMTFSFPGTRGQ
jgi:hypothetical protein